LENVQVDANRPPAVVVMPPDTGDFIIGNPEGFVRLPIAALKAARGEDQAFRKEPWWIDYELDWPLKGLKLDPSAHIYLPSTRSRPRRAWDTAWGVGAPLLAAVCLVVGLVTIVRWVIHLL